MILFYLIDLPYRIGQLYRFVKGLKFVVARRCGRTYPVATL